jgi:hypothetical protein
LQQHEDDYTPATLEWLRGLLKHPANRVRQYAVAALIGLYTRQVTGEDGDAPVDLCQAKPQVSEVCAILVEALDSPYRDVRWEVAAHMFQMLPPAYRPRLVALSIEMLTQGDDSDHSKAANILPSLGADAKGAVPVIVELLKRQEVRNSDLCEALLEIDPKQAEALGIVKGI